MMSSSYVPQPRRELLIAYLSAAAVATHVLESSLPGFGPWFKPGLANTFTLVAFFHLGWQAAAAVSTIRVVVGSLAMGTFLSPTFLLALSGAIGAVLTLGVLQWSARHNTQHTAPSSVQKRPVEQNGCGRLGPVGVSLLSALAHMVVQVIAAWLVIVGHAGIFLVLPFFLMGSWLTGIFNGLLAFLILERLARFGLFSERS